MWEKPDVPGANLEGLHYVKNIRKAMEFDKLLDSIKTVAVIGATPLGVEMAGNLGHRGLEVHFIDEGPWALHEVLDPDVAEPVHESLTDRGVTLHLGTAVEAFLGDDHVRAVATSARRDRLRRRDRLPAQDARTRRSPQAAGARRSARPAG